MQPSINTAFEAEPPSSPVQPDAGKQRFLAVSLLYTERTEGEVPERPLTTREVAHALGIGAETVRALCNRGVLEHFRVSNAIRVSREELARFIREHMSGRRARHVTVEVGSSPRRRGSEHGASSARRPLPRDRINDSVHLQDDAASRAEARG